MAKEFTKEMMELAVAKSNSVKGTPHYGAYYVPFEENLNGKWYFLGWGDANRTGTIKKGRNGGLFVYYTDAWGNRFRFLLTTALVELFNLTSEGVA